MSIEINRLEEGHNSFNDSLSTINSPLASSSPMQNRSIINNKLSKESIRILHINFQSIRNKKVALQNLLETTEADVLIGTETCLMTLYTRQKLYQLANLMSIGMIVIKVKGRRTHC
jgi:hypothetical protein